MGILCRIFGHWWQWGLFYYNDLCIGRTKTCRICGDFRDSIPFAADDSA